MPSAGIVGPAFTGEWRDANALQHHRARYYAPELAVWTALDPWEGLHERPMSLNGYSWVEGQVINGVDPSGACPENPWWNDIPGQRCVWLANELSHQYDIPLDILMQRDVIELEAIYAWGNLNNTFNESSWSQTLRNNPVAAAAIAGAAAIGAAAIVVTGGTATPVVLTIAGGAALGGISGAATGTGYGTIMYQIAASGQCGCEVQQQVLAMGQDAFTALARENAALYGTVYGGLISSGPVGQMVAGTGAVIQGGAAVYGAAQDIFTSGLTVCNTINGLLGVVGVLGGVSTIRNVYQSQRLTTDWIWYSRKLRAAAEGRGNFGIGSGTRAQADILGAAWVGPSYRVSSSGYARISADALRQYRPPSWKPNLGKYQANYEARSVPYGNWQSNAHLDIIP